METVSFSLMATAPAIIIGTTRLYRLSAPQHEASWEVHLRWECQRARPRARPRTRVPLIQACTQNGSARGFKGEIAAVSLCLTIFFLAAHYSASLHLPFNFPSIMGRNSTTQGRNKVAIGKGYGFGKHIKEDTQRGKVYRMTKNA